MKYFKSSFWKNQWRESGLEEGDRLNCMFDGLLCMHVSVNLNDWKCCCASSCECLCVRHTACCLRGAPFKKVGLKWNTPNGEYCRMDFPCCDCAVIRPRLLCGRASQFLCVHNTGAFPCDEDYTTPVCAYYFVSCWPRIGCCVPPPRSKALEKLLSVSTGELEKVHGSTAPKQDEMDRNSFELLKRKNSDDGLADAISYTRPKRKNSDDGMEDIVEDMVEDVDMLVV